MEGGKGTRVFAHKNMIFDKAKRPLIIYGAGIHLGHAEKEAVDFAHKLGVPVICTWAAADLFRYDDPFYIGTFGTHGIRAANFALQNANVVLSIGSRLDTKATGSPVSDFARKAKVFMVDVDPTEIEKFTHLGREIYGFCDDAIWFMKTQDIPECRQPEWLARIHGWKEKYPSYDPSYKIGDGINPYEFIHNLSFLLKPDDIIVSDTGCPVGWMAQAFKFTGQRFIHGWNSTPMGYGLPAAIGAAFAAPDQRIILITGDGGLGVNVTEFATLARHHKNVKVILFNNQGHAMCRQTQRTWMGGTYPSTSYEGGLATPDFNRVATAYDIPVYANVSALLSTDGMGFLEVVIDKEYQIVPQVKFGKPLEDAEPSIPREELAEIMR